ncbi:LodA/GoxA family CTQ-dependent oxidase [uncultured Salipiger sp.]|uniref:LodA/GoxA family CTQ-dependent oxidase n=1 Tax=uncultured Salipiger sp. TaxID=499810 RepID=UPI0025946D8B|nr:LodA/GoxA family CTQ-dependent oxidase [uncultured Salipiger sp.]
MPGPIVRAAIHPGLGIARMGNAREYYVGPQVLSPAPAAPGSSHADGLLKREAAEFRIYGYDGEGNVVAELTPANAEITWTAHLAARKASWYKLRAAMDLPAAADFSLERRNPDYPVEQRSDLTIDPGPHSVTGTGAEQELHGTFTYQGQSADAMIGELHTDATGRLRVLSGLGVSGSPTGLPVYVPSETDAFGNATGWYDEACDGPVTASVRIDGNTVPCEGAWVVIAPPNYARDLIGWRTMLDLLTELWEEAGWTPPAAEVSFTRDIYPLLERMTAHQWVNQGFAAYFGAGGPMDFHDPALIDRLARKHGAADVYRGLRRDIFNAFRPVSGDGVSLRSWPWLYGDAFGTFPPTLPANGLPLWPAAAARMQKWVAGDFIEDWGQVAPGPDSIDAVALADQPSMLDRAALHFCLADAFHPGIEVTWPLRHVSIWEKPFRIRARPADDPEPDYGGMLTSARALGPDGPLNAQVPGGLTRWMALPWQADTASCRSGYNRGYDPNLPTFWPVRVPNHVLTAENYARVMDATLDPETRQQAFAERRNWYVPLQKYGPDEMTSMVSHFGEMGVVERRPGPDDLPGVPSELYVEVLGAATAGLKLRGVAAMAGLAREAPDTPEDRAAQEAGWQSHAQREFFRMARMGHTLAGTYDD